jgi:hypothetical protein
VGPLTRRLSNGHYDYESPAREILEQLEEQQLEGSNIFLSLVRALAWYGTSEELDMVSILLDEMKDDDDAETYYPAIEEEENE